MKNSGASEMCCNYGRIAVLKLACPGLNCDLPSFYLTLCHIFVLYYVVDTQQRR